MVTDSLAICNSALTLIGSRRITSLSDPSKEARACNDNYDICRRAVLRMHRWNFAVKRVELTGKTVTNVEDSGGGLIKVTATAHGFSTGNRVTVQDVVGTVEANITGTITVVDANNFTFDGSTFANTYVSGGVAGLAPEYQYAFKHALPADFIRVHTAADTQDCELSEGEYRDESGYLLTNFATVRLRYVYDLQTTTKFDALFDEALAAYLASKICHKLTGSEAQKEGLLREMTSYMNKARYVNSTESPSETLDADEWIRARHGVNEGFVRDPMTN